MVTYPQDWKTYSFKKFFKLIPNNTLSRDKLSAFGTVGNIHYGDVLINYRDILSDDDVIPRIREDIGYTANNFLQKNDVVLADTAEDETVGKVTQVGDVSIPLVGGLHTVVCRPNIATADGYLGCYMNSKYYHDQLMPYITGIKVSSVSKKSLNETEINIPADTKEQDAIVDVFRVMDRHTVNLTVLIEKKKGIRDGALEDLVNGKTRLDEFSGEWREHTIEDITQSVITGGTPSTAHSEYYGGNIPWLSSKEIHQKRITRPTTHITDLGLQNSSAKMAPSGSVLIALAGQGKTRGTAAYLISPMALNQSLAALITNEKCNPEFLFFLIESMYLSLRELSSGDGGRGGLNKKLIKGVTVKIPVDVTEQKAIAAVLIAMDDEIEALEAEREKIVQIREGAMDDLLTGRVRIVV
jgi:type I restriction enzyme S subunit